MIHVFSCEIVENRPPHGYFARLTVVRRCLRVLCLLSQQIKLLVVEAHQAVPYVSNADASRYINLIVPHKLAFQQPLGRFQCIAELFLQLLIVVSNEKARKLCSSLLNNVGFAFRPVS